MDKNKKNAIVLSIVAVVTLIALVVGATYAYFQNQYGSASNADVNVTTYTTDMLTFETGDAINITADQNTFAEGKGNATSSTFARATLQANNKTNTATANYYVYLNISGNDFEYSKDSSSPELLLSITDNSGNQVTKLTGLNYITVTDGSNKSISGFDITKSSDLLTLVDNKEISASPKQIEEWNITITLVNYNYDQNANTGKNFSGKLIIQKEKMKTSLADYVISQYTGTQGENGLYYHDYTLSNGAGESSYRYAGANPNNYICFGSEESTCPDDNLYRIIGVFGDYNHGVTNKNLVKIIKNTSYGSIAFDDTKSNNWTTATLNTTLNATFLTSNLSGYEDKIETVIWKIGGYNNNAVTAKTFFDSEVTHAARTYQGKIGLMYISDYGFATTPDYWTTNLKSYDTNAKNYDWIYTAKSTKWSITPLSNGTVTGASEWYINGDGALGYTNANDPATVYPCFYLSTSVSYILGTGTSTDPYRVG